MANRYWVGGAGTWDATDTTHWSATSGGSGGASVPTSADSVFFNSASSASSYAVTVSPTFTGTGSCSIVTSMTAVVTIATVTTGTVAVGDIISVSNALTEFKITSFGTGSGGAGTYNCNCLYGINGTGYSTQAITASRQVCADINIAGPASGTLTWTTTTGSQVEVAGSITTSATGASAPGFNIIATGTASHTITSNGLSLTDAAIYLSGTGTYTLGGALTCGYLYTSFGTFTTANFALTTVSFDQSSSGTRTINLGSSTVNITVNGYPLGSSFSSSTVTLNAGTSTVNFTGGLVYSLPFGSKTWYNVALTATTIGNNTTYGYSLFSYGETNTFNNFSIAGQTVSAAAPIYIDTTASFTINGTFSIGTASNATCRLAIKPGNYSSSPIGTPVTITAAAFAAGASDVDWRDITIAGAAGTISGTRFGNCGGCTNIAFDAAKTVYWNLAGAQNWSATGWAATSGAAPAVNNFPLAQDTAVFDNTGSVTGAINIENNWNIGTINMSARTNAMTMIIYSSPIIYGNWTNGSGTTLAGPGILTFSNRTSKTINSAGKTFSASINIDAPGGGLQLLTNNLTTSSSFYLTRGTLDLNNLSLTSSSIYNYTFPSTITSISFGTTGSINLTGSNTTIMDFRYSTFTFTGTSQVNCTYSGSTGTRTIACSFSANSPTINVTAGSDTVALVPNNANFFGSLNFNGFTGSITNTATDTYIYGNLTFGASNIISGWTSPTTFAASSGTQTITTNGITVNFPIVASTGSQTLGFGTAFTSSSSLTISDTTSYIQSPNVTVSTFTLSSTGIFGITGVLTITGSGTAFNCTSNILSYDNGGYISMTSSSPKTFAGNNQYFPGLNQGGSGTLTITGSNLFGDFNNRIRGLTNSVSPCTILITGGTTQTMNYGLMNLNGTPGNLVTLSSTTATPFTIERSNVTGVNTCTYCNVSYMTGNTSSGTVLWRFLNSTNGGNNTNLTFAALYYWVGGSGTWNNANTTHWSLTSGGAGAQGPPTANDDVVFDTSSNATAYTVTAGTSPACFNMTVAGPTTGKVTFTLTSSFSPSVYGSLSLSGTATNGGVANITTGFINFYGAYQNHTLTTNGVSLNWISFQGVGKYTLGSALTCQSGINPMAAGTFDTSLTSNYSMTLNSINGNGGTINLNASTVTIGGQFFPSTTTFNAGTSTIICNGTSFSAFNIQAATSPTFYNVTMTNTSSSTFAGSATFNTLTITQTSQAHTATITAGTTQTVANLVINGTASFGVTLASSTSSPFTITRKTSGANQCTYCNVSYMTGTTTAIGGGSVIWRFLNSTNGGNNTNLTFANTYYWVGGSGTWNSTANTNWSLTSGGSGGAGVPTQNDDVVFNSSSNTASYVVSNASAIASCFNLTIGAPASGSVSINPAFLYIYGNFTATSSSNVYVASQIYYSNSVPVTLTPNGVTFGIFNNLGTAILTLGGALVVNIELTGGGVGGGINTSTSNYSITTPRFDTGFFGQGTFTFNASTININGYNSTSIYTFRIGSSCTVNANTSTINVTGANTGTYLLQFGGKTFYNVTLNNGNYNGVTYNITDTVTNTFNTFTYNGSSAAPNLNTLTLSGNIIATNLYLNAVNNNYNNRLFVKSDTIGTQRTITWSNTAANFCDFRDINSTLNVSGNGGDCGGNSGMTFPAAKAVYWNLAGTQNWSANGWSTSSGGTPAVANFPLAQDDVYFDNTGSAGTVTIDNNWNIGLLNMSNRTSAMTLATGTTTPTIYGSSWYYGTGVTTTGTGAITVSRATRTNYVYLLTNGVTLTQPIIIDSPGSGLSILYSNATTTDAITLTKGTLDLTSLTLTCQSFSSALPVNNTNTRTLAFGTGQINVTGSDAIIWDTSQYTNLTVTGTPTVNFTYSGSTGVRDIKGPNSPSGSGTTPLVNVNITAGSDFVYLDNGTFGNYLNVNFTGYTGNWYFNNGVSIYGSLTLGSGMTVSPSIYGLTFRGTSGFQNITSNGVTVNVPIDVAQTSGVGAFSFNDAFTSTSSLSSSGSGIFNSGSYNITANSFIQTSGTTGLTGGGTVTITVTGSGTSWNVTSGSITFGFGATNCVINMSSGVSKTFAGFGQTYQILKQGGAGALTITGNNTFADIQTTSLPSTITFPASGTTTVSAFTAKGTAGNLLTLQSSSAGTQFALSKSSGVVVADYLSLKDSSATGGAQWRAGLNSTIVSNVSGWLLLGPPTQIRASINSSGVLFVPSFNQLDEVSKSINSVESNALYSNLFDETQTLTFTPPNQSVPGSLALANTKPTSTTSNNYIQTANSTSFAINSTQDFTIEAWVKFNSYPVGFEGQTIFQIWPRSGSGTYSDYTGWALNLYGPGYANPPQIFFINFGGGGSSSGFSPTLNTWHHLAYTRQNGTLYYFINGSIKYPNLTDTNAITSAIIKVGKDLNFDGNITNLRLTIGEALYTSNFTPSTVPLTKQANTALLLTMNSSNPFGDSSNNIISVSAPNANVAFSTDSPFTFTPATVPVAQRKTADGKLLVSGYFDETTLQ